MEFLLLMLVLLVFILPIASIIKASAAGANVKRIQALVNDLESRVLKMALEIQMLKKTSEVEPVIAPIQVSTPVEEVCSPVTAVVETLEPQRESQVEYVEPSAPEVFEEEIKEETREEIKEEFLEEETEEIKEEFLEEETENNQAGVWLQKLEQSIGGRWATWLGVLALMVGAGFFVKYSIEHGWFGPTARIISSTAAGIFMMGLGERFYRKQMLSLSWGLTGGGLGIIYTSAWAAYGLYQLIPLTAAFVAMTVITGVGMTLAIRRDALSTAVIACLGGLLTPLLLNEGFAANELFAYLTIINLGVLAVSLFKGWDLLDKLAFIGTWAHFTMWRMASENPDVVVGTVWICVFFALFLVLPFINQYRRRTKITGGRFTMAMSNAVIAVSHAFVFLNADYHQALGLIIVVMSGAYLILGAMVRKRVPSDTRAVFGFLALFMTLLTMSIPVLFNMNVVTVGWAVEAVALLYFGYKYEYLPARIGGFLAGLLAVARVFWLWPWHKGGVATEFIAVFNPVFGAAVMTAVSCGLFVIIHHKNLKLRKTVDNTMQKIMAVTVSLFTLIIGSLELWRWASVDGNYYEMRSGLPLIWIAGFVALMIVSMRWKTSIAKHAGVFALLVATLAASVGFVYSPPSSYLIFINFRFLSALTVIFMYVAYFVFGKKDWLRKDIMLMAGIMLTAVLTHCEFATWFKQFDYLYEMRAILPIVWVSAFGALLIIGEKLNLKTISHRNAIVALCAAVYLAVNEYFFGVPDTYIIWLNARFISAVGVVFMFFVFARVLSNAKTTACISFGVFAAVILVHAELLKWFAIPVEHLMSAQIIPIVWSAGAGVFLLLKQRVQALSALTIGAIQSHAGYMAVEPVELLMINCRFAAALSSVGMFAMAAAAFKDKEQKTTLWGVFMGSLLVLLSVEVYGYFSSHSIGLDNKLMAQAALSVLWGLYATVTLVIGFGLNQRLVRLAALALFGACALKLVFIDLSHLQDAYRIVSFIVLGLLLVSSSYLYHKLEKKIVVSG